LKIRSLAGSVFLCLLLLLQPCSSNAVSASGEPAGDNALLMEIQGLRADLRSFFALWIESQRHLDAISRLESQLTEIDKDIVRRQSDLQSITKEKDNLDKSVPEYDNRIKEYDIFSYKCKLLLENLTERGFEVKQKIDKHQNEIISLLHNTTKQPE
jgi:chromosome segregation ATPase